jgi:hypothetical protein
MLKLDHQVCVRHAAVYESWRKRQSAKRPGSKAASIDDTSTSNGRPSKKRRTSPTLSSTKDHSAPSKPLPQNLTHTSQSSLPTSELAHKPVAVAEEAAEVAGWPGFPGLSDDEVFRLVTAPRQIEGLEDWGIPEARPQEDVDPALQVCGLLTGSRAFMPIRGGLQKGANG